MCLLAFLHLVLLNSPRSKRRTCNRKPQEARFSYGRFAAEEGQKEERRKEEEARGHISSSRRRIAVAVHGKSTHHFFCGLPARPARAGMFIQRAGIDRWIDNYGLSVCIEDHAAIHTGPPFFSMHRPSPSNPKVAKAAGLTRLLESSLISGERRSGDSCAIAACLDIFAFAARSVQACMRASKGP